ncbi:MAG: prolipoprotein diacylglyceryl transferase [Bacillota bacterium]|nr:prolipoprotein diacylglyceryl transferase [Bacillota bacterium]
MENGYVGFPGLGIDKIAVHQVAFKIFGIDIYWYGIILAVAFLTAVLLGMKHSKRFGFVPDNVIDLVIFAAPVSIIFARAYYVIFNWDLYKNNFWDVFNTRKGGIAIYGALIGAVLTAYVFAKVKKLKVLELFDFCIPYVVLAQAIGRWGNFVNIEAFGRNTNLPWRMAVPPERVTDMLASNNPANAVGNINPNLPVHPTFLYESLWDIGVFLILIWFRKRKKLSGEVFTLYLILYGIGRAWVEGLRIDSLIIPGTSIRVSQLLAVILAFAFAVLFLERRRRAAVAAANQEVPIGQSEYANVLDKLKSESVSETETLSENETKLSDAEKDGTQDNPEGETPENDAKDSE